MAQTIARIRHGRLALQGLGYDEASLAEGYIPEWIPVLPDNAVVQGRDGRKYRVDNLLDILKRTVALDQDIPVDIEHSTEEPGGGEAVGWARKFKIEDDLIWACVNWGPKGVTALRNKAQRYTSPAFTFLPDEDTDGLIDTIVSIGLVTHPNFNMPAVNSASVENKQPSGATEEETNMEPKAFRLALGLPENATEAEVLAKLNELKAAAQPPAPPVIEPAPVALNAQQITELVQTAVAAAISPLRAHAAETHDQLVDKAIDGYVKAGKIQPTEVARNFWRGQCATAEALKSSCAYLDQIPALVATNSQVPAGSPQVQSGLTPNQKAMCRRLGVSEEAYLKTNPEWRPFASDNGAN
jgi:phage I-like protein